MSIEYFGTPGQPLDKRQIDELSERLIQSGWGRLVRRTGSELGFTGMSADETAPETTTISLDTSEIYVAFHAATGDERDRLLNIMQSVLRDASIACELEER